MKNFIWLQRIAAVVGLVLLTRQKSLASFESGVAAFQERKWSEATDAFIDVLQKDPSHVEAHAYLALAARQMEADRDAIVRRHRLDILGDAAKLAAEMGRDPESLKLALLDTSTHAERARREQWLARCEEARLERQSGRLLVASDIVFSVLAEQSSFPEAQRELSELQSSMRHALDTGTGLSIVERYALEGFYAYGQADAQAALTAWSKVRTVLQQSSPSGELARRIELLRFAPYERMARRQVDENQRDVELKDLFDQGILHFQKKQFFKALDVFRKLAIQAPDFPQLGYYLVQTESAVEKERAARLGEHQQEEIERALQEGQRALDQQAFEKAEEYFNRVLRLDPTHYGAQSYLAMAKAEMKRLHDPKAAHMHYEAGLIAYASGKLDDAIREWRMALRMNPKHEKARLALGKVQKELAFHKEVDLGDEALP